MIFGERIPSSTTLVTTKDKQDQDLDQDLEIGILDPMNENHATIEIQGTTETQETIAILEIREILVTVEADLHSDVVDK